MKTAFTFLLFWAIAYYGFFGDISPQSIPSGFFLLTFAMPVSLIASAINLQTQKGIYWLTVGIFSTIGVIWLTWAFPFTHTIWAYFLLVSYVGLLVIHKRANAIPAAFPSAVPASPNTARPIVPEANIAAQKESIPRRKWRNRETSESDYNRIFGLALEWQQTNSLELPVGWKKKAGIYHRVVGNIDLLVTSPMGNAFNIEIKAWRGVKERDGGLVKKSGAQEPINWVVRQLWNQVYNYPGKKFRQPVLWLPNDPSNEYFYFQRSGGQGKILVVNGDQTTLKRAIGAIETAIAPS
jgi:hypothetical protein